MGIFDDLIRMTEQARSKIFEASESLRSELEKIQQDIESCKREITEIANACSQLMIKERKLKIKSNELKNSPCDITVINATNKELAGIELRINEYQERSNYLKHKRTILSRNIDEHRKGIAAYEQEGSKIISALRFLRGSAMTDDQDDVDNKQHLLEKIILVQEEERRRVARDIHDGPAQVMASLVLRTEICDRLLDKDIDEARVELHDFRNTVRQALQETRRIIYDLRPMSIDDLGIAPTIRRFLTALEDRCGVVTKFEVLGSEKRLQGYVEIGLFRIVQEALINCEKHAAANTINVVLQFTNEEIYLEVIDDGKGFDVDANREDKRFGLLGMNERVDLMNGNIKIESAIGQGTKIRVCVPLTLFKKN